MPNSVNKTIANTKLASLLQSLEKEEISRCKRFLQSPYFNSNKDIVKLYTEILRLLDRGKPLEKGHLWRKIAGKDRPYDDVRFRKFTSDLYKLVRQFLVVEMVEKSDDRQSLLFIESLIGRGQIDKIKHSIKKDVESADDSANLRDAVFHRHQHFTERKLYELFELDQQRTIKPRLEEMSQHADAFYLIEKLRLMCEISTRKLVKNIDYKVYFADEVVDMLENDQEFRREHKEVDLYFRMYKLLTDPTRDEATYFDFKEALKKHANLFPKKIQIEELFNAAQNYCVGKVNSGDQKFLGELFELFETLVDNRTIIINNQVTPWYFRNIVFVGLRLGKYDWVERFIQDFEVYLPENLRDNAVSFNRAQLYFYRKDYNQVLQELFHVEYDDLSYNLNSKLMLMLTYYELDEIELLSSHLDTFYTFLNRRKDFPEQRRKPYKELIRYTRKLIKVLPRDTETIEKLKVEILSNNKTIANASWLLEKLTELES